MSDLDASWPTTTPGARVAAAPDKVPAYDALSPGTRLDEFEIVRVLGTGGFGIVYLARDHVLLRDVAIKEYMPTALAGRSHGLTVSLRSARCAETFARGLESFLSEARLLASFDHPSLVKVHRFWRSNATAYMAMQYVPGRTLNDARMHMHGAPDGAWLGAFFHSLLGALELLHSRGVFHRDISPDNILMQADGQPVLLDFGSARRVVADGAQSFTAHLKPQFAPLEQYAEEAGVRQGPWTDLYALGATMHFVLTGRPPTPSVVRAARDVLPRLASLAESSFPHLPARLLATIDWTLALAPDERPQDVHSVRRALSGDIVPPPPSRPDPPPVSEPAAPPMPEVSAPPASASASRLPGNGVPAGRSGTTRVARLGAAAWLAVLGAAALGWGAYTLSRPLPVPPSETTVKSELPKETPRLAPPAGASPAPVFMPSADPVALRLASNAPPESKAGPDAAPIFAPSATEGSASTTALAAVAPRTSAQERNRAVRSKPRSLANNPARATASSAKNACSGSSLLSGALCVLNPCKSPGMRSSAQCIERLRAEDVRLRRVERE